MPTETNEQFLNRYADGECYCSDDVNTDICIHCIAGHALNEVAEIKYDVFKETVEHIKEIENKKCKLNGQ